MAIDTLRVKIGILEQLNAKTKYEWHFEESTFLFKDKSFTIHLSIIKKGVNDTYNQVSSVAYKPLYNGLIKMLYVNKEIDEVLYEKLFQLVNNSNYNS